MCDDYGGNAPVPVSVTHPPVNAASAEPAVAVPVTPVVPPAVAVPVTPVAPPAAAAVAPSDDARPISTAAAYAVLDLSDRPARAPRGESPVPEAPVEPAPPPRPAGAPFGVIRGARAGRSKIDAVAYDGMLVLASRGASADLLAPQLAAQDPGSRLLDAKVVDDVVVREDALSGKATIHLRNGEVVVVSWPGRKNRGAAVETILAHAFPGKVDQGPADLAPRVIRAMAAAGVVLLVAAGAWTGASVLLRKDPPPPAPAAAAPTLSPAEQAARAELAVACPPWQAFAAGVPAGERPDPVQLRPIVDGIRGRFDAAAGAGADASYAAARDEVAYLQDYGRRTPESAGQESVSRLIWAMRSVSSACTRAASAP